MTVIRIDVEKDLEKEKHRIINKLSEDTKKSMYVLIYTNTCGYCTALMGKRTDDEESTWGRAMKNVHADRLIIQCNYNCADSLIEMLKRHMENDKIKTLVRQLGQINGVPSLYKIKKSGKSKECKNMQENVLFNFLKI